VSPTGRRGGTAALSHVDELPLEHDRVRHLAGHRRNADASGAWWPGAGTIKGADALRPERTKELETGFDLGLFRDKSDLSFTYYNAKTRTSFC